MQITAKLRLDIWNNNFLNKCYSFFGSKRGIQYRIDCITLFIVIYSFTHGLIPIIT